MYSKTLEVDPAALADARRLGDVVTEYVSSDPAGRVVAERRYLLLDPPGELLPDPLDQIVAELGTSGWKEERFPGQGEGETSVFRNYDTIELYTYYAYAAVARDLPLEGYVLGVLEQAVGRPKDEYLVVVVTRRA